MPTFAELAGATLPADWPLDGHSFAPVLLGESQAGPGPIVQRQSIFGQRNDHAYVKDRRWKLYADGRFYDTRRDSWEKYPLPKKDVSPEAAASYRRLEPTIQSLDLPPKYRAE